jgi:HEAT repeat protein
MKRRFIFSVCIACVVLSCGVPVREKALRILEQGIEDESVIIRAHAGHGLNMIGNDQGVAVLTDILGSDDTDGIVAALDLLSDTQDKRLLNLVMRHADDEDPLIRAEAYRVIGLFDTEEAQRTLTRGIEDKIAKIRRISYRGIEKFKNKELIRKGLNDVDPVVRINAARFLAQTGETGMIDVIKAELKKAQPQVWNYGIVALAEAGDTSAISFGRALLREAPWELKIAAAEALLALDQDDGVEALRQGMRSNDPFIRIKVVDILQRYRIPALFEALTESTHDEYINVAIMSIDALAIHNGKGSLQLFTELMEVPHPLVKIAAARAYLVNL